MQMDNKNLNLLSKRAGIWFGIVFIIFLPLVFVPTILDAALMPRFTAWSLFLFGFFLWLFVKRNVYSNLFNFSILKRIVFPLLLGWFLITGTSIFVAINTSEAVVEWLRIVPFILFIVLGAILFSKNKQSEIILTRAVIVFALLQSVIGILQLVIVLYNVNMSHEASYYVDGLSSHRNLFSQILLFSIPFGLYGIVIFKKSWRILAIISVVFSLALITVLLVKSVWVALLIALVIGFVFFLNYFSHFKIATKVFRNIGLGFIGFIAIISISVIVYVQFDSWDTIDKQADWVRNYRFGSSLERLDLWEKSTAMYRDNPIRGIGSGNWKIVLPAYGTDGLRSEDGTINFVRPHNDFFSVLTETGIIGFVFYLGFFVSLFYYGYRIVKSTTTKEDKIFILFMLTGLISYLIISLLSFPKERVEHSIFLGLFAILILIKYNTIFPEKGESFKSRDILYFLVFTFLIIVSWVGVMRSLSEYHLKKALGFRGDQEWGEVIKECDRAENVISKLENTSIPIAWYRASALFNLGKHDSAFSEFRQAYKYHPNNIHVLNNLATSYELKGEHDKAIELYNRAIDISSSFEDAPINLCAVYFNLGDIKNAYESIKLIDVNSTNPSYNKSLDIVLKSMIDSLIIKTTDHNLKLSVERIDNSTEWIIKVYTHSIEKSRHFNNQVFEEAIYTMETVDSTITSSRAKYFRDKYIEE